MGFTSRSQQKTHHETSRKFHKQLWVKFGCYIIRDNILILVYCIQSVMSSSENYDLENAKTRDVLPACVDRFRMLRAFVVNLQKVIFETKLLVLFPAIPMAFVAQCYSLGRVSVVT